MDEIFSKRKTNSIPEQWNSEHSLKKKKKRSRSEKRKDEYNSQEKKK